MTTRIPGAWDFPGVEYVRPSDPMAQLDQITSHNTRANSASSNTVSSSGSGSGSGSSSSDHRRANSKSSRPPSRRVSFSNSSSDVKSTVSMDSTKASVGGTASSAASTSHSTSSTHHTTSLHDLRVTNPAVRPTLNAASSSRPSFHSHSSQQSSFTSAHHVPSSTRPENIYRASTTHLADASQDHRRAPPPMDRSQTMFDQGSYGGAVHAPVRVAPSPPTMVSSQSSASRPAPSSFSSSSPSLNHLGIPGYMGPGYDHPRGGHQPRPQEYQHDYRQPHPQAQAVRVQSSHQVPQQAHEEARQQLRQPVRRQDSPPAHLTHHSMHASQSTRQPEYEVPYRRPTDIATSLSMSTAHDSTDHFSHSDSCWDSEEDSGSCLSTSTAATAVSDVTVGKGSGSKAARPSTTSTGTATPTQTAMEAQSRLDRAPPAPAPILRRAGSSRVGTGHKSVPSTSRNSPSNSATSLQSTASASTTKTASSSSASQKTVNSNVNGGPTIHIEVQRAPPRSESQNDLRLRQQIEEALASKIEQLRLEQQTQSQPVRQPTPSSPTKEVPASVKIADKTTSVPKEKTEDATQQNQELAKLDKEKKEIEKRDLILAEKEKLEQEKKAKREHERKEKLEQEKKAKREHERKEREHEQNLKEEREQKERELQQQDQKKLRADFIEQGKMLEDIKNQLDEQAKTLESTQSERAGLKEARDALEKKCSNLEKSLSHVSDKEMFVVEQVASLQIIKEALQGRVGPLESEVEIQRADIGKLTTERDGLLGDTKNQLVRITELEKELTTLVEEKRALNTTIATLEKDKDELNAKVRHLETQNTEVEEDLKEAEEECDTLKALVETLKTAEADQKSKLEALTTERDALVADIEGRKSLAATQETSLIELRGNLANVEAELAKVQDANKELEKEHQEVQKLADELDEGQSTYKDLRQQNEELSAKTTELQAEADKLAPLETAKTELEERLKQLQADHEAAASALVVELSTTKATLEEAAAKVPELEKQLAEKAELEAKAADLEQHASQIPQLRTENAKLAEQLDAANKFIEALSAAQEAQRVFTAQNASAPVPAPASDEGVPPSPKLSVPPSPKLPLPESPKLGPQRKVRSRAPSECRSTSSKSSKKSTLSSKGIKDDMALVIVRNPMDRGSVQVVRKCDLRAPRSRSQPPVKD